MTIAENFQQSAIAETGTFLTDEEEQELTEYLELLISTQSRYASSENYTAEDAVNLAGLAFVAGRSYQESLHLETAQDTEELQNFVQTMKEEDDSQYVVLRLSPEKASKLIERLLGED